MHYYPNLNYADYLPLSGETHFHTFLSKIIFRISPYAVLLCDHNTSSATLMAACMRTK